MRNLLIGAAVCVTAITLTTSGAVADRLITGRDIKDGSIAVKDFRPNLQKKLNRVGAQGPTGPAGPQGPQGPQGPAASDRLGALVDVAPSNPDTLYSVTHVGGSFSNDATLVGRLHLAPGWYQISVDATFDRVDDSAPSAPILMATVRADESSSPDSERPLSQDVTALTGPFPSTGNVQQQAAASRIVRVTGSTSTASVYVWGYNVNGSTDGSGNYTAAVEASAVRVAAPGGFAAH